MRRAGRSAAQGMIQAAALTPAPDVQLRLIEANKGPMISLKDPMNMRIRADI